MKQEILERLCTIGNILDSIKEIVAVPDAIGTVHRKDGKIGIWWYNVPDGRLEYSEEAKSHFDDTFDLADPESRKLVRGRIGKDASNGVFVLIYAGDFSSYLPGSVVADIVRKLENASGRELDIVVDEEGRDLLSSVA